MEACPPRSVSYAALLLSVYACFLCCVYSSDEGKAGDVI